MGFHKDELPRTSSLLDGHDTPTVLKDLRAAPNQLTFLREMGLASELVQ